MLRHMTLLRKWRHLENDVMWRHHVGFLPKFQKMFPSLILRHGANLKSFAQFKQELWIFFHIMTSSPKILTSSAKMLITDEKNTLHGGGANRPPFFIFAFFGPGAPNLPWYKLGTSFTGSEQKNYENVFFSADISIFADDVSIFGDDVIIWKNIHNSLLNCANYAP